MKITGTFSEVQALSMYLAWKSNQSSSTHRDSFQWALSNTAIVKEALITKSDTKSTDFQQRRTNLSTRQANREDLKDAKFIIID